MSYYFRTIQSPSITVYTIVLDIIKFEFDRFVYDGNCDCTSALDWFESSDTRSRKNIDARLRYNTPYKYIEHAFYCTTIGSTENGVNPNVFSALNVSSVAWSYNTSERERATVKPVLEWKRTVKTSRLESDVRIRVVAIEGTGVREWRAALDWNRGQREREIVTAAKTLEGVYGWKTRRVKSHNAQSNAEWFRGIFFGSNQIKSFLPINRTNVRFVGPLTSSFERPKPKPERERTSWRIPVIFIHPPGLSDAFNQKPFCTIFVLQVRTSRSD